MRHTSLRTRLGLVGLTAGLLAAAGAQAAVAHNQIAETTPAAGAVVSESPLTVSITTLEPLLQAGPSPAGFGLTVTDASGGFYGDGCIQVAESTLSGEFALGAEGAYLVTYQFVSADGHTVSDQFSFDFDAPAGHLPTQPSNEPPVCGQTSADASAEPTDATDSGPESEKPALPPAEAPAVTTAAPSPGPTAITAAVAAGISVIAAGALWWLASRRSGS